MMDDNGSNVGGPVTCLQAATLLKSGMSTDGEAVMLLFSGEGGKQFSLVLPTHMLGQMRHALTEAVKQATQRKIGSGQVAMKMPRTFSVGHNDGKRGHVVIIINPDLVDEEWYIMADADGLNLAASIRNNVMNRMSAADRAKLATAPMKSKLILPGH